ncbi:LysM peptidoglycan-binding domain-containing protein [Actinomycetospora endophytica]|uniref:LysM peptidoglycan-binding domain-containing protein n=1 Tax=Actinomycetospora endophytica TaxID=2291215 RepID=A0ABS8PD57_9PSEU|nr:LysM peptidoglycan-binding domain-containing protein [Actinomycetospora endophytica]MCD2196173.1 LysM peptidoglycan-binding domain-containing protein [Actinomycetospora endophytica]
MAFETYTVRAGDTLTSIAKKFGTTVDALLAINPDITDPNKIFVDQVINIRQSSQSGGDSTMTDFAIVVNINGDTARSSDNNIKVNRVNTGIYSVTFPQDISRWLWQATLGAADDSDQQPGSVTTQLGAMGANHVVTVHTFDAGNNFIDRPFHLRVHDL